MEWDTSSFGNESAQTWLQDLAASKTGDPIRQAIEVVDRAEKFVDAQDAERAIAACELVAASRGFASDNIPSEAQLWIKSQKYRAPDSLSMKAILVVTRIMTGSELRDLWDGTDAADAWLNTVRDLQGRLSKSENRPLTTQDANALSTANVDSYFNEAVDFVAEGNHEAAVEKYNAAIALEPAFVVGFIGRGTSYLALGRFEDALTDLNRAIDLEPEIAEAYHLRAQAYFQTGKTGRAIADLTILINMDSTRADGYFMRGIANADMGRFPKAVEDFSKAIELDPDLVNAYLHRSRAYERSGRFDLAGKDLKHYERLTGSTRSL
ncbi:MAG: tetratricopeptide repeat protein [Candidatus Obscuribacterales bacterium]|nr:tetratricopeptide repeat protein [Candidatus Obscuribacterales bacterium]